MDSNRKLKTVITVLVIVLGALILGGITGGDLMYHLADRSAIGPLTRDDIDYIETAAPAATSSDGTVSASDWEAVYPEITFSMRSNADNSYVVDYLEEDPYLVNIYEGYGFAKDYGSARGHEYCLEDVAATERPHPYANCLTCKTPNFTKLVNDMGVAAYTLDFNEVLAKMEEDVSCYTCHGNSAGNGGEIVITHSYVTKALGDSMKDIDPSTLSCGQCHIEYYFTVADKETMMPYHDLESMHPDKILEYYNAMDFADWTCESTGVRMLKAQHPEFETFLMGQHAASLNCADCHMEIVQTDEGSIYYSHYLTSPLDSPEILSRCIVCHGDTDMTEKVRRVQERITARETEVGTKLSDFKDALEEAVAEGKLSEKDLDAVRQIYREAQWYFDFCYVENSEGAHNSDLAVYCLDTAEAKIAEGMAILAGEHQTQE
ncbi:MAG: ammonia-forming cytochrome c nitrite reductase subunit c552 [Eubacteriaceae bacterium]|nr:ammonia-forming cytochrome c nitrite reductase subunit c552 [Eubacteriaceae bacterium]